MGKLVPKIIIRFSSSRLSLTSFFLFFVLTCNRVLPGFVWDASGLMGLAADVGASRNAPVISRLLQLFPTPTLGRCLSGTTQQPRCPARPSNPAVQHDPAYQRFRSTSQTQTLILPTPDPSAQIPDPTPRLNLARGRVVGECFGPLLNDIFE